MIKNTAVTRTSEFKDRTKVPTCRDIGLSAQHSLAGGWRIYKSSQKVATDRRRSGLGRAGSGAVHARPVASSRISDALVETLRLAPGVCIN